MNDTHAPEPLKGLERKLQVMRDYVTAVAKGYKTALYLHGPGGVGKSYTVLRHLEALEAPYVLYNARMRLAFIAAEREQRQSILEEIEAQRAARAASLDEAA